jgi:hypothetical protein
VNWWRARTILILSFLVLDVFLGYTAFAARDAAGEITGTEVQRVAEQLKANGITVTADIPRQVTAWSFLAVKKGQKDPLEAAKRLLGSQEPRVLQSAPEITVWADDRGAKVTSLSTGVILYDAAPVTAQVKREYDLRSARQLAEKFIADNGLLPQDAKFDTVKAAGTSRFVARWRQDYQGAPLFGGYITVVVDQAGVSRVRYAWFTPVVAPDKRRMVMPATDALQKALPDIRAQLKGESTLEAIELGYLADTIDAREWDAYPVWRLSFANGQMIYLNGYSGDFDRLEDIR